MDRFENFRIGRTCPLLVIVKRLKPLMALSGTVYRLASSMSDHTPVLFNVFEDWNEESVISHISFVSFVINYWLLNLIFIGVVCTADSIRDSIQIRIVTPDSTRIRFKLKRPIRWSLFESGYYLHRWKDVVFLPVSVCLFVRKIVNTLWWNFLEGCNFCLYFFKQNLEDVVELSDAESNQEG